MLAVNCLLHSFDGRQDVSACDRYSEASHIRDSNNLAVLLYPKSATGANEHPCAVAPLGYIPVPELLECFQVIRVSNAFCIHICHRRTSILGDCLTLQRQFLYAQAMLSHIETPCSATDFCPTGHACPLPPASPRLADARRRLDKECECKIN